MFLSFTALSKLSERSVPGGYPLSSLQAALPPIFLWHRYSKAGSYDSFSWRGWYEELNKKWNKLSMQKSRVELLQILEQLICWIWPFWVSESTWSSCLLLFLKCSIRAVNDIFYNFYLQRIWRLWIAHTLLYAINFLQRLRVRWY